MADRFKTNAPPAHGLRRQYKCVVCASHMRLKSREAHPTQGASFELQTYRCPGCGNTLQVSEPTPGAV